MSTRKIDTWHEAGLIDAETRARLIAYEHEHARPLALWAVYGIGALAIGLGLISVVAANWDDIPGQVRLAVHMLLILGVMGGLGWRQDRLSQAAPWAVEALLFIAALLGLTFFGHIGQVYQTGSPLWQPVGAWLVLLAPLLLIKGRSWLAAALLMGAAIFCAWDYALSFEQWSFFDRDREIPPYLWIAIVTSLPVLAAPLGAWARSRGDRETFWKRLEQLALAYAVVGGSLSCVVASAGGYSDDPDMFSAASTMARAVIALIAGALVVVARPGLSGRMSGAIIAGAGLTAALSYPVDGGVLMPGLLFMLLWLGIAGAALQAGWRGVFQMAVAVIALRLIVLSFELASDLLLSGFGLIFSGILILAIAYAALKVSREFAPVDDEDEPKPVEGGAS